MTTLMHIVLQATTPTQAVVTFTNRPKSGHSMHAYRASFCIHQGMLTSQVAAHLGPRSCVAMIRIVPLVGETLATESEREVMRV